MTSDSGVFVDAGGPIATVTIDRPKVLNALDEVTLRELGAAFAGLTGAAGLRCVIVTGAGPKAFVAGADISSMTGLGPREARAFAELGHELGDAIEAIPVPVIAAVGGFALGARLRAGAGVRLHLRVVGGQVRAARGEPGRDPRLRRHATAGAAGGPGSSRASWSTPARSSRQPRRCASVS